MLESKDTFYNSILIDWFFLLNKIERKLLWEHVFQHFQSSKVVSTNYWHFKLYRSTDESSSFRRVKTFIHRLDSFDSGIFCSLLLFLKLIKGKIIPIFSKAISLRDSFWNTISFFLNNQPLTRYLSHPKIIFLKFSTMILHEKNKSFSYVDWLTL